MDLSTELWELNIFLHYNSFVKCANVGIQYDTLIQHVSFILEQNACVYQATKV